MLGQLSRARASPSSLRHGCACLTTTTFSAISPIVSHATADPCRTSASTRRQSSFLRNGPIRPRTSCQRSAGPLRSLRMNGGTTHAPCTRPGSTPCSDSTSPNRGKTLPTGPSTRAPQSASQPSVRRRVQNAATACSVASPSWSSSAPSCGMSKMDVRSLGLALGGLPEPSERPSPSPPAPPERTCSMNRGALRRTRGVEASAPCGS